MAKKPKDDGTRHGRMEGPKFRVSKERAARGGHIGIVFDEMPVIYDIDMAVDVRAETIKAAMAKFPGQTLEEVTLPNNEGYALRPYQREMISRLFDEQPTMAKLDDTIDAFKDRYAKGGSPTGRYGGKMRDLLRQSSYHFASGSADFLRKGHAMRRFYALGGGEGNRQLAYYAYGMELSRSADNWVDDIYDRRLRRAEAKLREYCMADVWFTADYASVERMILLRLLLGYTPIRDALPAPYGYPMGNAISLRREELPDRQTADMIGGLMIGWGCPSFVARRVADCMYASGRYDCRVTVSQHGMRNLFNAAMALRVIVTMTDDKAFEKADSARDIK